MISESYTLEAPFFDVDSMDIVWHGHYCKYFELARCKLLDKIGYNYNAMAQSGFGFPIIDMRLKYVKPIRFEQKVIITATLVEWQFRLKINYLIRDAETEEKLTSGYTIQAAVDIKSHEMRIECPAELTKKVTQLL